MDCEFDFDIRTASVLINICHRRHFISEQESVIPSAHFPSNISIL